MGQCLEYAEPEPARFARSRSPQDVLLGAGARAEMLCCHRGPLHVGTASPLEEQSVPAHTHIRRNFHPLSRRGVVARLITPRYSYEQATLRPARAHAPPAWRADGMWAPARCAALCACDGTTEGALDWANHS